MRNSKKKNMGRFSPQSLLEKNHWQSHKKRLRHGTAAGVMAALVGVSACDSSDDKAEATLSPDQTTGEQSTETSSVKDLSNFKMATSLSLVSTQNSGAASLALNLVDPSSFGADTDFAKDATKTFVHDLAFEPLDSVNEILCSLDQLAFGDKAKADFDAAGGVYPFETQYVAQIDDSQCSSRGESDSSGQSSGSSKSLSIFNVHVSRQSATDALHVKGWFDESAGGGGEGGGEEMDQRVVFDISIGEPAAGEDSKNSFGVFKMNFAGFQLNSDESLGQPMMRGLVNTVRQSSTGLSLQYIMEAGGGGANMKQYASAELTMDADGEVASGVATTHSSIEFDGAGGGGGEGGAPPAGGEGGAPPAGGQGGAPAGGGTPPPPKLALQGGPEGMQNASTTFDLAFNNTHFLRSKEGGTPVCLSVDKPDLSAWRYAVYNSDGSRLKMNGGFPLRLTVNGRPEHAFASYWGVHLPPHLSLKNGDKVTKEVFSENGPSSGEEYTVVVAPGKLIKNTKRPLTKEKLSKISLEGFTKDGQFKVAFDGVSSFAKTHKMKDMTPGSTSTMTGPQWEVTTGAFELMPGHNMFFSEGLGQIVVIRQSTGALDIFYYEEELASNTLASGDLYCLRECPRPGLDATAISKGRHDQTGAGVNYIDRENSNPVIYQWDAAAMSLKQNSLEISVPAGTAVSGENSWGFRSGALVTKTVKDTLINPWDIFGVEEFYTWEFGANSFNKYTGLKGADGALVKFDRPRFFDYTHKKDFDAQGDNDSTKGYFDRPFSLQYEGFGNLHGIPSINHGEGNSEGGDSEGPEHYAPAFTIKSGTTVTDSRDGKEYIVKILEAEERLRKVADADCGSLATAELPLPSIDDWQDPVGDGPLFDPGDDVAPAVVEGELQ